MICQTVPEQFFERELTNLLRSQGRLVPKSILMNLDLAWQAFTVWGGPHEYFREPVGSPAFHLHQDVLLDDIR
jgi:hypothetical protein